LDVAKGPQTFSEDDLGLSLRGPIEKSDPVTLPRRRLRLGGERRGEEAATQAGQECSTIHVALSSSFFRAAPERARISSSRARLPLPGSAMPLRTRRRAAAARLPQPNVRLLAGLRSRTGLLGVNRGAAVMEKLAGPAGAGVSSGHVRVSKSA